MPTKKKYENTAKKVALDVLGLQDFINPETGAVDPKATKKIGKRYEKDRLYAQILNDLEVFIRPAMRSH